MSVLMLLAGCDDNTGVGNTVDVRQGGDILDDSGQTAQNRLVIENPPDGEALELVHNSDSILEVRYVTPENTPISDATINFEIIQSTDDCEFSCLQPDALQGITDGDGRLEMKVASKTLDADVLMRISVNNNEAVQPVEALIKIRAKNSFDLIVKWNYDGIRSFEGVKPLLFAGDSGSCEDLYTAPLREKGQIGVPASRQNPDAPRAADGTIADSIFTSLPNGTTYTVIGYAETEAGLITVYGCNDERPTIADGVNTILEVDLQEVPILLAGTYKLTSNFDLTSAFPRTENPSGFGEYQVGNYLDLVIDLFRDPGTTIWNLLLSIEQIANLLPDVLKDLGPVVGQVINSTINEFAPDWIGNALTIANDITAMLTSLQLEGELVINDEPDEFGVIPPGQVHRYFAVTFAWTLPCETGEATNCAPITRQLKEVTGDPTLDVSGTWEGSVKDDQLTIDRHGLLIPIGAIALGIFETVALPAIFDDPRVNSLEKFVDAILITNLVESFNNDRPSDDQIPCGEQHNDTICDCSHAGDALSGLILGTDGGFANDVASTVGQYACEEGVGLLIGFIRNFFDGISVDSKDNLLLSTASPCPLLDLDGNLEFDAIGEANARCDWVLDVTFSGDTNYVGTGLFFGTRGGL